MKSLEKKRVLINSEESKSNEEFEVDIVQILTNYSEIIDKIKQCRETAKSISKN